MSSFSHLKERQPLQKNTVNLRWCCWHLVFKLLHEGYFKTIFLLTNYCHYFNFQVIRQQSIILPSTYVHTCFLAQGFHQVLSRWLLQDPKTMKSKNMLKYSMMASSPLGGYCEKLAEGGGKRKEELTMIFGKFHFHLRNYYRKPQRGLRSKRFLTRFV